MQYSILGVDGRHESPRGYQRWLSGHRYRGDRYAFVEIEFNDRCKNGHDTFSITYTEKSLRDPRAYSGGASNEAIQDWFPELAPLLKWHLCSTDGPLHYLHNTIFLAGERDCWGKLRGEPLDYRHAVRFGDNPITHKLESKFATFLEGGFPAFDYEVIRIDHEREPKTFGPKFTFGGYADKWYLCPFDSEEEALELLEALQRCSPKFLRIPNRLSEGKKRELDAARRVAVWPDATDEDLTADGLEERLKARLPALLDEFKSAMVETCGFEWRATRQ